MEYVGIDWATRRAAWCALNATGEVIGEGFVPADPGVTREFRLKLRQRLTELTAAA